MILVFYNVLLFIVDDLDIAYKKLSELIREYLGLTEEVPKGLAPTAGTSQSPLYQVYSLLLLGYSLARLKLVHTIYFLHFFLGCRNQPYGCVTLNVSMPVVGHSPTPRETLGSALDVDNREELVSCSELKSSYKSLFPYGTRVSDLSSIYLV